MLVDSHCHIFTKRIVQNIKTRPAMVEKLRLDATESLPRLDPHALEESAEANGVDVCLLLPTALPEKVRTENDRFTSLNGEFPRLRPLATLHPMMRGFSDEILRVFDLGVTGFKFSSFSQRLDLSSRECNLMISEVERLGRDLRTPPVVVLDTFVRADRYFGAHPSHLTTPSKLAKLVYRHPGINFVAAHMGGLLADFDEIRGELAPVPNLYLDTSNAAHTLKSDQFIDLLRLHGSSQVLFGTDWPWFSHETEIPKIRALLVQAGYDHVDQAAVFGENARRLFGF